MFTIMIKAPILITIAFTINSCCTKTSLSPDEKTWVSAYKLGQKIVFRGNRGNSDTLDVIKNKEFYTNCDCNWFEIGTTQAHTRQIELKPRFCRNKSYCSIIVEVSKKYENKYSPPFFRVFGLEHPDEFYEEGENSYLNNLTKNITLSTTGKRYQSIYFFKSGTNAENYGSDYLQSFYWDKVEGLVRYESTDGEVFELLKKQL